MKYFAVGKIINTHGIQGEVKILAVTDFAMQRFQPNNTLYVKQNNQLQPLKIRTVRRFKQFYLLRFFEYADLTSVEKLKNCQLLVDEAQQTALSQGNFYYHQIIGLTVVDQQGKQIGKIKEILSPGANDVWVVERTNNKELLLPAIKQVIKKVDLDQQQVEVELMDGLDEE